MTFIKGTDFAADKVFSGNRGIPNWKNLQQMKFDKLPI
jgi:hypothetical protein